jgi:hypothetical protein
MENETMNEPAFTPDPSRITALLIVHGIGEQKKGETTQKLINGLKKVYGDRIRIKYDDLGVPVRLELDQHTIRLYEVYWADILSGDSVRDTFRWETIQVLGWFPWLNWKFGLLDRNMYSRFQVIAWSFFLIPATLLLYLLYTGTRFLTQISGSFTGKRTKPEVEVKGTGVWAKVKATSNAYAIHAREERTVIEELLDQYAGDVTNYMFSVFSDHPGLVDEDIGNAGEKILGRFHRALAAAEDDNCTEIQILSHSLGTVVSYHGLTGLGIKEAGDLNMDTKIYKPAARLTRLYTIGSPLEKIRFIWPTTIRDKLLGSFTFLNGDAVWLKEGQEKPKLFEWNNFYHKLDIVSGKLKRFNHWGNVKNHPMKGGGGLARSHVVYEQSPDFLRVITEGLFGSAGELKLSWSESVKDRLLSTLENAGLPVALILLFVVGLALGLFSILLPGYIFSLPFRAFGAYDLAFIVQDVISLLMLTGILIASTFGIRRKARTIFEQEIYRRANEKQDK